MWEGTLNPKEQIWDLPWKFKGPHQIQFFIWLALKQRLLTNVERIKQGVGTVSACGLCGHEYGGILHVFRNGFAARSIWVKLVPDRTRPNFYIKPLHEWMMENLQNHQSILIEGVDWSCLFVIILWHICKNRNLFIFQGISWSIDEVLKVSLSWARQYTSASKLLLHMIKSSPTRSCIDKSWVCLNTNGSVRHDESFAVIGGWYEIKVVNRSLGFANTWKIVQWQRWNFEVFWMGWSSS